ncbi:hypothetical protein DPEC_G00029560 [Dallia pectoralis]|uniref:Uncharacterized protein n=1 Tax=Dallia pectoralis TaxID=75939 RepID=A0ACC2HIH4_DALPE|nr:hypothetical protein DPEC_G00029560 [Dallia pectoralis]
MGTSLNTTPELTSIHTNTSSHKDKLRFQKQDSDTMNSLHPLVLNQQQQNISASGPEMSGSPCEQQMERYSRDGYISAIPVLNESELREARQAFSDLEREFGEEYTQYSLHNMHLQYPWVLGLAKHPRVLQVVQNILGSDVILLDSRFICKYSTIPTAKLAATPTGNDVISLTSKEDVRSSEKDHHNDTVLPFVAWHQDMRYWGIAGGPVLSVWVALDDSLADNGALKVIPGSHHSGMQPHRAASRPGNMLTVNQEIPEELVQTERSILCPLLAGQMSIHDGLLVHGSEPNTSGRRRCGFVVRYTPTCAYTIEDPDRPRRFHATVMASGTDQFRHFSNSF